MKITFKTLDKYLPLKNCGEIVAVLSGETLIKLINEADGLKKLRNALSEFNNIEIKNNEDMDIEAFSEMEVKIESRPYYIGVVKDKVMLERHKAPGLWVYDDEYRVKGFPLIQIWEKR